MTLIGIYGMVGSGKNIISTIDDYYTPREIPIYCNFDLKLPNAEIIEPEEVFEVFEVDKAIPIKKLVTDEAYGWFENRNSGVKDENQFFSYLMFQSRKIGLVWKSIAQLRGTLDLRWRGMENKVIYAHERDLDMSGNSLDDFHYSIGKRTVNGLKVKNISLKYDKSKRFFNLYNTNQRIVPRGFDNLKLKMHNKNRSNLNEYLNSLALELYNTRLQEIPIKKLKNGETKYLITQERIRDILLRMEKDPEYSSNIKVRVEDLILKNYNGDENKNESKKN